MISEKELAGLMTKTENLRKLTSKELSKTLKYKHKYSKEYIITAILRDIMLEERVNTLKTILHQEDWLNIGLRNKQREYVEKTVKIIREL